MYNANVVLHNQAPLQFCTNNWRAEVEEVKKEKKKFRLPILKIIVTVCTWSTNSSLVEIFKRHFRKQKLQQYKSTVSCFVFYPRRLIFFFVCPTKVFVLFFLCLRVREIKLVCVFFFGFFLYAFIFLYVFLWFEEEKF